MQYPYGMPRDLQQRVEAARDLAEVTLRAKLSDPDAYRLNHAYEFITDVFREFAKRCCEAERLGIWEGSAGRQEVERFLERELIPHAYELARLDRFSPAPFHSALSVETFRSKVVEKILQSEIWTDYLKGRLAHTESLPGRVTEGTIARRQKILKTYRTAHGLTADEFARKVGMSDTAIRGVVNEDRTRFNDESQRKLLQEVGVSRETWYTS